MRIHKYRSVRQGCIQLPLLFEIIIYSEEQPTTVLELNGTRLQH